MLNAKRNSIISFGLFITEFRLWKEVPKKSNEVTQRIRNPINSRTLARLPAHIPPIPQGEEVNVEEAAPATNVQG